MQWKVKKKRRLPLFCVHYSKLALKLKTKKKSINLPSLYNLKAIWNRSRKMKWKNDETAKEEEEENEIKKKQLAMVRWQVRTLNVSRIYQIETTTHHTKRTRYVYDAARAQSLCARVTTTTTPTTTTANAMRIWFASHGCKHVWFNWNTTASHTLEVIFSPLQQFIIQISVQTVGRINFVSSFLCVRIDDRGCGVFLSSNFVFINFTQLIFFF